MIEEKDEVYEEGKRYAREHLLDDEVMTLEEMLMAAFVRGVHYGLDRAGVPPYIESEGVN